MFPKWLSFRTLSIALAMVLIVTAALKLHLLLTDPFADIKTGVSLPFLWLGVFAEAGVVWVVFSNVPDVFKWLSLISLFSVMAVISAFNVLNGKISCGCAGSIEVNPVWFLAFDAVGCITLLLFTNSIMTVNPGERFFVSEAVSMFLAKIVALGVSCAIIMLTQTHTARAITNKFFFGLDIEAEPFIIRRSQLNGDVTGKIVLRNNSSVDRIIVGVNQSCTCILPENVLRAKIPARGELFVQFVAAPKRSGRFHQRILFYLDSPQQHVVAADLFGHLQE